MREKLNFHAVHYYEALGHWLGGSVITLTVLLGAGIKVGSSLEASARELIPGWALGLAAFAAALLSGLQTFLKPADVAQKHRNAAARYGALKREIDEMLALPPDRDALKKAVDGVRKKLDDIEMIEPPISDRLWKTYNRAAKKKAAAALSAKPPGQQ